MSDWVIILFLVRVDVVLVRVVAVRLFWLLGVRIVCLVRLLLVRIVCLVQLLLVLVPSCWKFSRRCHGKKDLEQSGMRTRRVG